MENLSIEHRILILLFLLSYAMSMWIQSRDRKIKLVWSDYPIVFVTGAIGAIIAYFIAAAWANIGLRMAITVIVALMFPRAFIFLTSKEAQSEFSQGFFKGIMSIMKKFINQNNQYDGDNRDL